MATKTSKPVQIDINKIKVEPVHDYFERADVSTILSRHHPLGEKKAIGRRMVYAASYRGQWLAVLLFDKAVDRNKHRKSKIGWTTEQEKERVKHVANNSRFVVMPNVAGVKNLASKVLSLVSERISDDWFKRYGIRLLALETYVDPEYNDNYGTCYEASGWENLGYSTGYSKDGGERTHSKWYYLKPLHKDSFTALSSDLPHALITGVKPVSGGSNNNYVLDASKIDLKGLQKELARVPDPRKKQGRRYRFVPLLSLCISAVLSGHTQYRQIADWISTLPADYRARFGLPGNRVPHESTIGNLFANIASEQLSKVLTQWLIKTYHDNKRIKTLCLDGKALRGTSSVAAEQKGFLNVFASELGIVIEHSETAKGGAEKSAAREFVEKSDRLEGKVVLADAIHTDKKFVVNKKKKKVPTCSLSKVIRSL